MVTMFFYGIFKRGPEGPGGMMMHDDEPVRYLGRQHLDGWTLHASGIAYAHISDREDAFVEGDVYEVPEHVVEGFFDRVEGHPHHYQRVGAVTREGTRVQVYKGPRGTERYPEIGPRWTSARVRMERAMASAAMPIDTRNGAD